MGHDDSHTSLLTFSTFQHAASQRNHALLERHRAHEQPYPVSFAGRNLIIDPHVFCPTIGEGSQLLGELIEREAAERVLDVGTGSGALAIVAAQNATRIVASDVSPFAVRCARKNVETLGLADRIDVRQGDLFASLREGETFDLIVFNPPFLEGHPHDALEVSVFDEGYDVLRRFFLTARRHLATGGKILIAFGDVGNVSYLNYLARATGFSSDRIASRTFDELEFFVLQLRQSR